MNKILRILSRTLLFSIALFSLSSFLNRDNSSYFKTGEISSPIAFENSLWVDSIMSTLTLEQRISQLFMYAVYSNKNEAYNESILELIEKYQIGGVIFMQGGPHRQVQLNNRIQQVSKVPLMVGFDGEWGLGMRLDSVQLYPRAMALGAIQNEQLVFDFGVEIARQCRRMGIHINFTPVIDINSNPDNPIINSRSFGEDKYNVARKGLAVTMGMQSQHVLAVGKHFPGHGDTHSDSHHTLPVISHSRERLDTLEFYPFRTLINNGLGGVMVAHMAMPSLVKEAGLPSSLSKEIITDILKTDLAFNGLVFTDALNMKGVTRDFESGDIEVKALQAGNDVLLFPLDIELALIKIKKAIESGQLTEEVINERCRKVLMAKDWLGLSNYLPIEEEGLMADLHTTEVKRLEEYLVEASVTVVDNKGIIPVVEIGGVRIASVVANDKLTAFDSVLNFYKSVDSYLLDESMTESQFLQLYDTLKNYDRIIISQYQTTNSSYKNYGISTTEISYVERLMEHSGSVLALFANPYALRKYTNLSQQNSFVLSYDNSILNQKIVAQIIFGGRAYSGKAPVSSGGVLSVGDGEALLEPIRLSYVEPSAFGFDEKVFDKVDSLAKYAIESGATPGCQIFYAKDGKVVYNKTFGYHTYQEQREVNLNDLYDVASVTKVVASTMALMKMYELKLIEPSDKISKHLNWLKKTDKKNVRINEIVSHQSGFHSWIPFYRLTLDDDGDLRTDLYRNEKSDSFSLKIMDDLFLRSDYHDTIFQTIIDTPLYKKKKYRYSDLGYYFMPEIVKTKAGLKIDEFVNENYYKPLGMERTVYNPLEQFSYPEIAPSEHDKDFRKSVVHGYVNDQGAAMLGGVSGHAGLFSTSNDIGKLSQMLLNGGVYGGKRYLDAKTIDVFNHSYYKRKGNRRALGFDKPALKIGEPGPTCASASPFSFGHSGFTGAYFWVDPENQSVYVFISNRTFPDQSNKKLADEDIRTNIHQLFYDVFDR